MNKGNLTINDQEFIFSEKSLLVYLTSIIKVSSKYVELIDSISDKAFEDVKITSKLKELANDMKAINESLQVIEESLNGKTKEFIEIVDEKDTFIY